MCKKLLTQDFEDKDLREILDDKFFAEFLKGVQNFINYM